jgi:hypothetical protein
MPYRSELYSDILSLRFHSRFLPLWPIIVTVPSVPNWEEASITLVAS